MADWGKKEGKREVQKLGYFANERSFLCKIKSSFHNFLRAFCWWNMSK